MKTSTSNICICGHSKEEHDEFKCRYTEYDDSYGQDLECCPCKHFKPRLEDEEVTKEDTSPNTLSRLKRRAK